MKLLPTLVTTAALAVPVTAAGVVVALAPFAGSAVDPVATVTQRDDHHRREHDARLARTRDRHHAHEQRAGDDHGGRTDRDDRTEPGDDRDGRHHSGGDDRTTDDSGHHGDDSATDDSGHHGRDDD